VRHGHHHDVDHDDDDSVGRRGVPGVHQTGTPGGICGNTLNGTGGLIKNLTCGGLNIGGGSGIVPEAPTPDGSTSRFALSCAAGGACDGGCAGLICNIGPTSIQPPINSADPDWTDVGCNFGTPLEIPNPAVPSISACVLNTWSAPAGGFLDLTTPVDYEERYWDRRAAA
jgi:hypothetical protein